MTIGKIAKQIWKAVIFGGEALDFLADVLAIGKTAPKGEIPKGETREEKIKARILNIGRADEAIISRLSSKLKDKNRATFLGFKMWLAKQDRVKHFVLRRHLAFLYDKGEKEAVEAVLDIVSKLEAGGNEATLEYCDGMEITYDSTIALLLDAVALAKKAVGPADRQINRTSRRATREAVGFMRRREVKIANRPFWRFW